MQLSLLILPNSHFSQRSDILWRRRSWKIPLVRVFTICQGSIAAHEGALLRPYDACLSRRFPGSGASHSFTQEAFLAPSLLLVARFAFLSRLFQPNPILCVVGRLDGRGKRGREQRPRMCRAVGPLPVGSRAGVASFSSSRMYSQDGSMETTRCLLTLSLSDSLQTYGAS